MSDMVAPPAEEGEGGSGSSSSDDPMDGSGAPGAAIPPPPPEDEIEEQQEVEEPKKSGISFSFVKAGVPAANKAAIAPIIGVGIGGGPLSNVMHMNKEVPEDAIIASKESKKVRKSKFQTTTSNFSSIIEQTVSNMDSAKADA